MRRSADVDSVAPDSPVQVYLDELHRRLSGINDGEVATYIPPLSKADPNWFSICIATTDGNVYETGDADVPFTIQSISKPLVYGIALQDQGPDGVMRKIGVEPTGDAFNSISLDPKTGRPFNPMINAGAIAATSLVAGRSSDDKRDRLLELFSLYAGRPLSIDEEVFRSERETGHRNRAIGHMLRNFDILPEDPEGALDLYFQQCSILVTCRDLSLMAATLANGGVNPRTGEMATATELVPSILSVMTTCGMYDFAGEWAFAVGMPAKSGVAGGILAVLPGQLGIGIFSPPLDPRGNSVRGVAACRELSRDFNLHFLRAPRFARSVVRAAYDVSRVSSKRNRNAAERALLEEHGERGKVYELQGDIGFAAAERVVRQIVGTAATTDISVLDLKRVARVGPEAARLFADLLVSLAERGKTIVLASPQGHPRFLRFMQEELDSRRREPLVSFLDIDRALEWCEWQVIKAKVGERGTPPSLRLSNHPLSLGLSEDAVRRVEAILEIRHYEKGSLLVSRGDTSRDFYLLLRGEVSVGVTLPDGQYRRLATLAPGMSFGELGVIGGGERSADVRADSAVECLVLGPEAFERLGRDAPQAKIVLLENMLRNAAATVNRLTREVAALSG
jgi:glutaminase